LWLLKLGRPDGQHAERTTPSRIVFLLAGRGSHAISTIARHLEMRDETVPGAVNLWSEQIAPTNDSL
jgi:hypothetical protein